MLNIWLYVMLPGLNEPPIHPIPIFENNTSCITRCENTTAKGKLKHIEKSYLTVRNHFENKE